MKHASTFFPLLFWPVHEIDMPLVDLADDLLGSRKGLLNMLVPTMDFDPIHREQLKMIRMSSLVPQWISMAPFGACI